MSAITATGSGGGTPPVGDTPDKHPLLGHAEAIAKLSTVVLGGLFVLGIIISNVQFIDLGISDFASLQTRNVLIGFVFVLYFALMLLMLFLVYLMIAAGLYSAALAITGREIDFLVVPFVRHFHTRGTRITFSAGTAVFSAGFLYLVVTLTGQYFDYAYPWGQVAVQAYDFKSILTRFRNAYLTGNNITAIGAILGAVAFYLLRRWAKQENDEQHPVLRFWDRVPLGVGFLYCAFAISVVLAGYADNIYPNLRYNLGGGQPQVAKLVFSGKKSDVAAAGMFGAPLVELCCDDPKSEQAIKTDQLVIWYQSDKFVYVSALHDIGQDGPRAQVIAADLKLVRDIQYLPRYVQIQDGNKIVQIYQRNRDDKVVPVSPTPVAAAAPVPTAKPIVWTQLHPDDDGAGQGQLIARAIVEDGAACPSLTLADPDDPKGKAKPMEARWSESKGAFPIKVCEAAYPGNVVARIGAATLKPRPADPKKILVIGDTGCRLAKWGMQDCNDPDEWPFQKLAERAAALDPDLIIHVGDYQYREACLEADAGKCAGLALGDVWPAWRKDFFEPAGKLLSSAPWVMLRGNHEDMGRAGAGWLRLFSPFPRSPGEVPLPDDVRPYLLRFGSLTLAVLDVANEREPAAALVRSELYARWIERLAPRFPADVTRQNWLFLHVPPWVHHGCKEGDKDCKQEPDTKDTLNPMRDRLRAGPPPKFDLVFAGDTHMFQFFVPRDRKIPAQVIAGMSGTLLEAKRAYDAAPLDKPVGIDLDGTAGDLWMHRGFGFLVLTKDKGAWSAALYDTEGKKVVGCSLDSAALDDAQANFPCQ